MKASSRAGILACGLLTPFAVSLPPADAQVRAGAPVASFSGAPRGAATTGPSMRGPAVQGAAAQGHAGRGGVARPSPQPGPGGPVAGRHPSGSHHHHGGRRDGFQPGVVLAPPYVPYVYEAYGAPRETVQQVFVQPVVTQTQILTQIPAYDPVTFRCSGPRIIEVKPTRGRMKTPRVIYGTPDPCQHSAAARIRAAY